MSKYSKIDSYDYPLSGIDGILDGLALNDTTGGVLVELCIVALVSR